MQRKVIKYIEKRGSGFIENTKKYLVGCHGKI